MDDFSSRVLVPEDSLTGQSLELRRHVRLQVCHSDGRSPAIVFLHGGLGNRFNWRSQYEFAQAQGWEALVYDLAGHGQSTPYPRDSIGRHCRDLTRLLQHFQIHNPVLCCHSYGVPIGLEWAQRHPTRALILIAGGTHDLTPWWEFLMIKLLAWGGRHLYRLPNIQQWTAPLLSPHPAALHQFFAECPLPIDRSPYQTLEVFWGYNFFNHRKTDQYRSIPTLVISGGRDPVFTEAMGDRLAAQFQHSCHLHLPDAGHLVMAEFSERVNQAIARWIDTSHSNPG